MKSFVRSIVCSSGQQRRAGERAQDPSNLGISSLAIIYKFAHTFHSLQT
jgi:hypothetical protein